MVYRRLAAMVILLPAFLRAFSANGSASSGCILQNRVDCTLTASCADPPPFGNGFHGSYDLRVHSYIVVNPKQQPPVYHLMVNVTWRPPHEKQCSNVTGFEVALKQDAELWQCYTINVGGLAESMTNADEWSIVWFWSSDLFSFGSIYEIQITTLPRQHECTVSTVETMPNHPDADEDAQESYNRQGCVGRSNSNAYKWVSAFKLVYVKPWQKSIDVQFVAAPITYCLHAYELRLMRTNREIVQSMVVDESQLRWTTFDNVSVGYGDGSFSNVQPGSYFIGVIPIDRDEINVCKCPVPGGLCSCSLAIQPNVVMPEISLHSDPCETVTSSDDVFLCQEVNRSHVFIGSLVVGNSPKVIFIVALVAMILSVLAALCLIIRKWKSTVKGSVRHYMLSQKRDHFDDSKIIDCEQLLPIESQFNNILIIYSRDSTAHIEVVKYLVKWLQSMHPMNRVYVDYACRSEIMENKYDWMVTSVKQADRIVFVNSYGSYMRYRTKLMNGCNLGLVERKDADQFDDLFLGQVDLLVAELFALKATDRRVVSIRFSYTPLAYVLPVLSMFSCYELPTHMTYFMGAVVKSSNGDQLINSGDVHVVDQLKAAIEKAALEMETVIGGNDWFHRSHCLKVFAKAVFDEPPCFAVADMVIPNNLQQQQQHSCSRRRADSEPIVNVDDSGFGSAKSHSQDGHSFAQHQMTVQKKNAVYVSLA